MLLSMSKVQNRRKSLILNVGSGRSITINYLYKIMKKKLRSRSKFFRKKLEKFDPKKSSGSFNKLKRYLSLKKDFFTKLEDGIQRLD